MDDDDFPYLQLFKGNLHLDVIALDPNVAWRLAKDIDQFLARFIACLEQNLLAKAHRPIIKRH